MKIRGEGRFSEGNKEGEGEGGKRKSGPLTTLRWVGLGLVWFGLT